MTKLELKEIARNIAVKKISKYEDKSEKDLTVFSKGTSVHIKAAIVYNRLLRQFNQHNKYEPIADGDKIIYVYLKPNKYRIEVLGLRGDHDSPKIANFAKEHLDYERLFEKELRNKLDDFYNALDWGKIPTEVNQNITEFFE